MNLLSIELDAITVSDSASWHHLATFFALFLANLRAVRFLAHGFPL